MKKALYIFLGVIGFLILALITIPFLFKDKIKAKIDSELAKSVNATILYDADQFSLSLIRHFPNVTISLGDLALIGKAPEFQGDTLFKADKFTATADVMSVIFGDKIKIKGVYLNHPKIVTIFAKNGKMSWDLMIPQPEEKPEKKGEEELTQFTISVEEWEIKDGHIIYDDRGTPMYAELQHVDHSGSGDFTQDVVDLRTHTKSPNVYVSYDNVAYLEKRALDADLNLNMNMPKSVYSFKENNVKINDFQFGFDGSISMPGNDIGFDLTFAAKETSFKSLLSLIPAVYAKDFDKIETDGKISFDGSYKGVMGEKSMPGYTLNLKIHDAMMKYPDLPSPIKNIATDLSVVNKDGVTQNIVVDLKKFHMEMGKDPVDARVYMAGISPAKIEANIKGQLDLAEVSKIYPMDGLAMKGAFAITADAKGVYDTLSKQMPVVNAVMSLANGYVKSKDFPEPIENLNFHASASSDGTMPNSKLLVDHLKMSLQGEPFEARLLAENFDNIKYDAAVKGIIDLTKITKIYPLEGMKLEGKINADITTAGVMSDVEAGKYDKTSTSGTMEVNKLKYWSKDMPQGMTISNANFAFSPEKMDIKNLDGTLGKSDIKVNGYVSNYMGYMFANNNSVLHGKMDLASNTFDVNEWMTEEPAQAQTTAPADTAPFEVPNDIDFVLSSAIAKVLYTNMTLENLTGNVIMKDGIVRLDNVKFNMLGGTIATTGSYNTQDIKHPLFDMNLDIKDMGIKDAYKTFNTVKTFAPIAQHIEGKFNSLLSMKGELGKNMIPLMASITGNGNAAVLDGKLTGSKVLQGISNFSSFNGSKELSLKDVKVKFKIQDGKVEVEPFDVKAGDAKMNVSGNNRLDGVMDYLVKLDVPAGTIGSSVNSALGKIAGGGTNSSQNIKLDLKVGGTYNDPKVTLAGSSVKDQAQEAVENKVKDELQKNAEVQKAKDEAERLKKQQQDAERQAQEEIKRKADEAAKQQEDAAKKKAEEELKKKMPKLPKF